MACGMPFKPCDADRSVLLLALILCFFFSDFFGTMSTESSESQLVGNPEPWRLTSKDWQP